MWQAHSSSRDLKVLTDLSRDGTLQSLMSVSNLPLAFVDVIVMTLPPDLRLPRLVVCIVPARTSSASTRDECQAPTDRPRRRRVLPGSTSRRHTYRGIFRRRARAEGELGLAA